MSRDLAAVGFSVVGTASAPEAVRATLESQPNVVLVAVQPGDRSGLDLIRQLRAAVDIPIVAIGPVTEPKDSIAAFDAGADDVMPYSIERAELGARLHAALRRHARLHVTETEPTAAVTTGDLVIDRVAQVVMKHGTVVRLTRTEFRLLDALATRVGQVATHRFLLSVTWGDDSADRLPSLRVCISELRQKLEEHPSEPEYILTERNVGYRLAIRPPAHLRVVEAPGPASEQADEEAGPGQSGP